MKWGAQAGGKVMLRQRCSKPLFSVRKVQAGDCPRQPAYKLFAPYLQVVENLEK